MKDTMIDYSTLNTRPEDVQKSYVHPFIEGERKLSGILFVGVGGIIACGILSGFILTKIIPTQNKSTTNNSSSTQNSQGKMVVGVKNGKEFHDSAEGQLEEGGIDGEGTHKLLRPGGDSQTVYLTSSVLDLNQFVGKKVKVWGETFAAKTAAWLMDVGKVEVLE